MKIKTFCVIFFAVLFSCNSKKAKIEHQVAISEVGSKNQDSTYKIIKMDSVGSVYVVYAIKSEKYYKIFSKKK